MKNATRKIMLLALAVLLLAVFAGCNGEGKEPAVSADGLQIGTLEVLPNAYLNEAFDLREILLMEESVEYSATACYVKYTFDEATGTYSSTEVALEVNDLCFTPPELAKNVITITGKRGDETASKVVILATIIRADPLDDILYSGGSYSLADPGISKSINMDSAYLMGESSKTSLYVTFNGVDPHPWGNTFIALDKEEVQKHFTDQTWKNAILTFWVYNPNEKALEFQLRLLETGMGVNLDWSPADGPNKQIAQPGQWTQIFFPLRKLGVVNKVTTTQYNSCAFNVKVRYEDYSTTDTYSYNFYVDGIDVVDSSAYPEIDNTYVLSNETIEQGWENMAQDTGWQGVYTEYNYDNIQGENSTCSLKAYFNNDKAMTNSFICLAPEMDERITELPDMTGGKFSAYFKFENMDARVSLDIVNKSWTTSNQVDFTLTSVGDGWYYGEVDLEDIQVGTGLNDQIIRIRMNFHGVSKDSIVYVDTCKFEYKYVHKVLEAVSVDWINMVADTGSAYYYTVKSEFVTSHLQGGNSVRSLKLTAPSGDQGRYTLNTDQAAINGEISVAPNMNKGTLGAWFYFGDKIPEAYAFVTNNQWHSSNWIDFIFTKNAGNGWYYGQINASGFKCSEGGGTSTVVRLALVIPAGYTVYVDNLSWKAGVENELVSADVPKPGSGKYAFKAGEHINIPLKLNKHISQMTFEYKIESGEEFHIALMPNWDSYFGYYGFNAEGGVDNYDGITCEALEDGVIRVTMDMKALTKMNGKPSKAIDFVYIRGDWTDASGYIANIDYIIDENADNEEPVDPPAEGEYAVVAGEHLTINLETVENLKTLSFEYQVTGTYNMALMMEDWSSYYGYFGFNENGNLDPYDGVTVEKLEDGFVRLTFDIAKLSKMVGTPNAGFTMLYIRGDWTDANGIIRNIVLSSEEPSEPSEPAEPTEPTEPTEPDATEPEDCTYNFLKGQHLTIVLNNTTDVTKLSFDYKIESGNKFVFALMPDWENYYGYIDVDSNGLMYATDGMTAYRLENGMTRLVVDLASVNKVSGSPSKILTMLYIRGDWTDANGIITNICLNDAVEVPSQPEEPTEPEVTEPEVTEPEVTEPESVQYDVVAGKDLTVDIASAEKVTALSFKYKVTNTFNMALMTSDWSAYYGYFAFDQHGNVDPYDGVTVEKHADGYILVTFDIAKLSKMTGNPNGNIPVFYVRGNWTDANGTIFDIRINEDVSSQPEEPTEPEVTEPEITEPEATEPEGVQYDVVAGKDLTVEVECPENLDTLSFEYKVTNTFNLALMTSDWSAYYGYFAFDGNGNVDPYDGVTVEELSDGYILVTIDIAKLTKETGNPNGNIAIFYVRGNWTDANGTIRNITLAGSEAVTPDKILEGTSIAAGADRTIMTECTEKLTYITFDYKIAAGGTFNIALMPNWDSYFGYYAFDVNGQVDPYDGITCEKLENDYIRVTFDMAKLTKYSGSPAKVIEFLYIRGNWTDASGEITNICLYWNTGKAPLSNTMTLRKNYFLVSTRRLMELILEEECPDND